MALTQQCAVVYDDDEGHVCQLTSGKWAMTRWRREESGYVLFEAKNADVVRRHGFDESLWVDDRQDVSDLIALLERVRERLPEK